MYFVERSIHLIEEHWLTSQEFRLHGNHRKRDDSFWSLRSCEVIVKSFIFRIYKLFVLIQIQWKLSFKFGKPLFKGTSIQGSQKLVRKNVHIFFVSVTSSEGTALFRGKGHVFSSGSRNLDLTSIQVDSITSCCSANEPALPPKQTAGSMGLLLSITTKQIVACSNRAGSINLFSWSRFQTADVKVLFDVACKEKQNVKLWRHNCWRQQNGLNAVFLTIEIKIKIYLIIIFNNYTWIFENRVSKNNNSFYYLAT